MSYTILPGEINDYLQSLDDEESDPTYEDELRTASTKKSRDHVFRRWY